MPELQFSPDFDSVLEGTHVFIQWKGTDVCLDLHCECGAQGHFDGYFAYDLRCGKCGKEWALPHSVSLRTTPPKSEWAYSNPKDVEMDTDD